jgi:hypothetical protein
MIRLIKRASYQDDDREAIEFLKEHMDEFLNFADIYIEELYKDLLDDNEYEWLWEEDKYGNMSPKTDEEIAKKLASRIEYNILGGYIFAIMDFFEEHNIPFHQTSYYCEWLNKNNEQFMNVMKEKTIPKLIKYIHARFEGF